MASDEPLVPSSASSPTPDAMRETARRYEREGKSEIAAILRQTADEVEREAAEESR